MNVRPVRAANCFTSARRRSSSLIVVRTHQNILFRHQYVNVNLDRLPRSWRPSSRTEKAGEEAFDAGAYFGARGGGVGGARDHESAFVEGGQEHVREGDDRLGVDDAFLNGELEAGLDQAEAARGFDLLAAVVVVQVLSAGIVSGSRAHRAKGEIVKQQEIVDGLREERERIIGYLEGLEPAAWEKASLCEGWTVRDVAAHLAGNMADVVAGRLEGAGSEAYNQRQVDERADKSPAEILEEWKENGARFEAFAGQMTPEVWDMSLPGDAAAFGTIGYGIQRLLEDLWVHAHDIRTPLGQEIVPGPGIIAGLEVIANTLPERCAKRSPAVGTVTLATGAFSESVRAGDGNVDVRVEGDPATLVLVGTGRISLDSAAADGRLTVTPSAPEGFAAALNIYGS